MFAAAPVRLDQVRIGKRPLRILVEIRHVGVAGHVVNVEGVLLDVFGMVPLIAGQAEEPLFENRVPAVPQRDRETQRLLVVADARDPVFAPAVSARTGMIVREELPRRAVGTIVFAHRSPLALAQIRAPAPPIRRSAARVGQPQFFGGRRRNRTVHGR